MGNSSGKSCRGCIVFGSSSPSPDPQRVASDPQSAADPESAADRARDGRFSEEPSELKLQGEDAAEEDAFPPAAEDDPGPLMLREEIHNVAAQTAAVAEAAGYISSKLHSVGRTDEAHQLAQLETQLTRESETISQRDHRLATLESELMQLQGQLHESRAGQQHVQPVEVDELLGEIVDLDGYTSEQDLTFASDSIDPISAAAAAQASVDTLRELQTLLLCQQQDILSSPRAERRPGSPSRRVEAALEDRIEDVRTAVRKREDHHQQQHFCSLDPTQKKLFIEEYLTAAGYTVEPSLVSLIMMDVELAFGGDSALEARIVDVSAAIVQREEELGEEKIHAGQLADAAAGQVKAKKTKSKKAKKKVVTGEGEDEVLGGEAEEATAGADGAEVKVKKPKGKKKKKAKKKVVTEGEGEVLATEAEEATAGADGGEVKVKKPKSKKQAKADDKVAAVEGEVLGTEAEEAAAAAASSNLMPASSEVPASNNMPASSEVPASNIMPTSSHVPTELQQFSKSERRQRAAALKRAEEHAHFEEIAVAEVPATPLADQQAAGGERAAVQEPKRKKAKAKTKMVIVEDEVQATGAEEAATIVDEGEVEGGKVKKPKRKKSKSKDAVPVAAVEDAHATGGFNI